MRNYECMIIFSPAEEQARFREGVKKYLGVILSGGGEITKLEEWGRRKLAYQIDKHGEGDYVVFRFRADSQVLTELDRQLRLDESILRHLIVKDVTARGDEPKMEMNDLDKSSSEQPKSSETSDEEV